MLKYLIIFLLIMSCSSHNSPEGVLRAFVDKRLNEQITIEDLDEYLTGDLLDDYTKALKEDPNKLNESNDFKKTKLSIIYKSCSDDECSITYALNYDTDAVANKTKQDVSISVKKIALIVKVADKWLISDISDVKSYYEFKE